MGGHVSPVRPRYNSSRAKITWRREYNARDRFPAAFVPVCFRVRENTRKRERDATHSRVCEGYRLNKHLYLTTRRTRGRKCRNFSSITFLPLAAYNSLFAVFLYTRGYTRAAYAAIYTWGQPHADEYLPEEEENLAPSLTYYARYMPDRHAPVLPTSADWHFVDSRDDCSFV